jgi:hypothetical protein
LWSGRGDVDGSDSATRIAASLLDAYRRRPVVGSLIALLWPACAWAQARVTGADVQGTVRDATGAVMA